MFIGIGNSIFHCKQLSVVNIALCDIINSTKHKNPWSSIAAAFRPVILNLFFKKSTQNQPVMKVAMTHCHHITLLPFKKNIKQEFWLMKQLVIFLMQCPHSTHNFTTSVLSCYLQYIHMMRNKRKAGLREATACSHQHKICICFLMKMCLTYRVRLSSSSSSSSIVSRSFCIQSTFSQNKTLMSERHCRYWASKTKEAKLRHQRKHSKNMKSRNSKHKLSLHIFQAQKINIWVNVFSSLNSFFPCHYRRCRHQSWIIMWASSVAVCKRVPGWMQIKQKKWFLWKWNVFLHKCHYAANILPLRLITHCRESILTWKYAYCRYCL